jgi:hypothetical protein
MFIPVLPLYQASLLSSVSMTSFTLFSNFSSRSMGIIPLINQKYEPFPITAQQKVKAWNSFFTRAMVSLVPIFHSHFPLRLTDLILPILLSVQLITDLQIWGIGVSVASAGTSFLTAYIHPDPQVRTLSLLSGISSLLIGPSPSAPVCPLSIRNCWPWESRIYRRMSGIRRLRGWMSL